MLLAQMLAVQNAEKTNIPAASGRDVDRSFGDQ
jgi:hypothetical protein